MAKERGIFEGCLATLYGLGLAEEEIGIPEDARFIIGEVVEINENLIVINKGVGKIAARFTPERLFAERRQAIL